MSLATVPASCVSRQQHLTFKKMQRLCRCIFLFLYIIQSVKLNTIKYKSANLENFVNFAPEEQSQGRMNFFKQLIPKYLLTKRNQILMVSFVAIFALIFINIFKPFRSDEWIKVTPFMYSVLSLLIVVQGVLIISVSRYIMFLYTRKHLISYGQYTLWILCELFVLASSYTVWSLTLGLQDEFPKALHSSFVNTTLLLITPCTLAIVYRALKEKEEQLRQFQENHETAPTNGASKSLISFHDGRGGLLLSVARENFLYIEASDNYVSLWYLKNDLPRKAMIRLTMNRVVEQLQGTNIVRCHRSFMVNLEKIRMVRRDKDGLYIEMGIPSVKDIPVSKTYGDDVMRWILNN